MKSIIKQTVNEKIESYKLLAADIHAHPEVCDTEVYACEQLSQKLIEEGFMVKTNIAGHQTGFDARYESKTPGPTLVFLAEYDALPGLGHACGHNLFGATSLLAAVSLKSVIDTIGGSIRVYGTPGEEGGTNGSAKESFVREGFLDDVDAALCLHSAYNNALTSDTLANDPVDIEFFGRASHAAAAPEHGINALDAIINVFNSINALREHLSDDVRIHGIITDGGVAANIVPEYAKARFYLRAKNRSTLSDVYKKVENIAKGAALSTGCEVSFGLFQNKVDDTVRTPLFDQLYLKNFESLGESIPQLDPEPLGSSDVGNISYKVPTIQPMISISDTKIVAHTPEFCEAAISEKGLNSIAIGAQALAFTAFDLIANPDLLVEIKDEHTKRLKEAIQ